MRKTNDTYCVVFLKAREQSSGTTETKTAGDRKLYVRGVGTVLEQTEKGPNERNELVSYTRG